MENSKALLIVDVQNDFLPAGALPVPKADEIVITINSLMNYFELVVATKDWHPKDHCSFATTHKKKVGDKVEIGGILQELWPEHCLQGSLGAEFPLSLNDKKIAKVFLKGTDKEVDSYSGFFDNKKQHSTGLAEYLREKKIKELFIVGLAIEYCVKNTVLDACDLGFTTYVITDCCKGIDLAASTRALQQMQLAGVQLISSNSMQ